MCAQVGNNNISRHVPCRRVAEIRFRALQYAAPFGLSLAKRTKVSDLCAHNASCQLCLPSLSFSHTHSPGGICGFASTDNSHVVNYPPMTNPQTQNQMVRRPPRRCHKSILQIQLFGQVPFFYGDGVSISRRTLATAQHPPNAVIILIEQVYVNLCNCASLFYPRMPI